MPILATQSLAQIDAVLAGMPLSGRVDRINWSEQYPYAPETHFTLAHTVQMLYVRFEVKGELPLSTKTQDLQPVNEDACVEFFLSNADGSHYWNFEFNPAGVCNASVRKERKLDVRRLSQQELASILRYPRQYCSAHWSLLIAIPLSLIELDWQHAHGGYRTVQRRANFYKCGDRTGMPHYASWSPIVSDTPSFHLPAYFGEICFELPFVSEIK